MGWSDLFASDGKRLTADFNKYPGLNPVCKRKKKKNRLCPPPLPKPCSRKPRYGIDDMMPPAQVGQVDWNRCGTASPPAKKPLGNYRPCFDTVATCHVQQAPGGYTGAAASFKITSSSSSKRRNSAVASTGGSDARWKSKCGGGDTKPKTAPRCCGCR